MPPADVPIPDHGSRWQAQRPELSDETAALLRDRLQAVSLLLFLAFGLFLLRGFFFLQEPRLQPQTIAGLLVFGASWILLARRA